MKCTYAIFGVFLLCACSIREKDRRPNIIIILVDDMGFSDIGCYGSEILTPNIDSLASGGLQFTQFYNASRCCPTRASLLTGLYPHEAGMGDMVETRGRTRPAGPYQGWLSQNTMTLAEVLREAGYATFMSGKWHVGEDSLDWPLQRGFEKYFGLISGANSYFEILPKRKVVSQNSLLTELGHNFYMTDALTDSAQSFLASGLSNEKPFFLYLAYTAPHWPLHATEANIAKYRGKYLVGWDSIRTRRHKKQLDIGLFEEPVDLSPRDSVVSAWIDVENKNEWDLKMAAYAGMITAVDDGVGAIVRQLKEAGEWENTFIVFLSDNGACHEVLTGRMDNDLNDLSSVARMIPTGQKGSYVAYGKEWANACNTPFRLYKHWTHEGGIHTPFIISYPALVKEHRQVHDAAHVIDIMPTVLELSHGQYPSKLQRKDVVPLEGISLMPLVKGDDWSGHDFLFWEHEGSSAVRKGKWKLVRAAKETWELYDMKADGSELHNVAGLYPDTVTYMIDAYEGWANRVGVRMQ